MLRPTPDPRPRCGLYVTRLVIHGYTTTGIETGRDSDTLDDAIRRARRVAALAGRMIRRRATRVMSVVVVWYPLDDAREPARDVIAFEVPRPPAACVPYTADVRG